MKILTVCLVIFILGFDFATPQGNKKTNKLLKAIKKIVEKLDKKNENGFNGLNGKLTNVESQNEDDFNNLNGKLTNIQSQNENGLNKLTNIESQNEVLGTDLKEQTNLTMAKLDVVYNDVKNDSEAIVSDISAKLDSVYNDIKKDSEAIVSDIRDQTNLTKVLGTDLKEQSNLTVAKIDATHQDMKNDLQDQFNKSMDKFDEIQLEIKSLPCSIDKNYFDIESGNCYKYVVLTDKERNWYDSKTACVDQGGALVNIKSREEWQFVKGIMDNSGVSRVWLGGSDEQTEGTWVWTDGSSVSYSDWYPGEPNENGNCLYACSCWNWQWGDYICTTTATASPWYAVCKIPA